MQRTWLAVVAVIISHDLWIMRPQRRHARRALHRVIHLKHRPATQREQADPDHHPEPHQQHRPRPVRRHPGHNNLRHSKTPEQKRTPTPRSQKPRGPRTPHNNVIEKETDPRPVPPGTESDA
ncbi:MAG: hypothetical protein ACK6A4_18625, partial [Alphaproteobacteria bacterium]